MRVAFYTNLTARDSLGVLQRLESSSRHRVVRVYFYDTVSEARQSPMRIWREFGTWRLAVKVCEMATARLRRVLMWSCSMVPGLRRYRWTPRSAWEWAQLQRVPCSVVGDLNDSRYAAQLRDEEIDVLLVCICKNILRRNVLETPRVASINIHPSLLPRYRGPMPIFWMLYHGDMEAGVTFQRMTERIDAGPVVAQFPVTLDLQKSEVELSRQLFQIAAEHVDEVLTQVAEESVGGMRGERCATEDPGCYYSYPSKDDIRELSERQRARDRR